MASTKQTLNSSHESFIIREKVIEQTFDTERPGRIVTLVDLIVFLKALSASTPDACASCLVKGWWSKELKKPGTRIPTFGKRSIQSHG